jgi:hypothetical protein
MANLGKILKTQVNNVMQKTGLDMSFFVETGNEFKEEMQQLLDDAGQANKE